MKIILVLLMLIPSISYSQIVINDEGPYPQLIEETYHSNGTLKIRKIFDSEKYSELGKHSLRDYSEFYDNGQLRLRLKMKDSLLHGSLVVYWKNGRLKRKDLYRSGVLQEGKIWDKNGNELDYSKFEIPSQVKEN